MRRACAGRTRFLSSCFVLDGRKTQRGGVKPAPKRGAAFTLPNGQRIYDPDSPSKVLMSPVANLSEVAETGRVVGLIYQRMVLTMELRAVAEVYIYGEIVKNLGHGGTFDYQRSGNLLTGFTQLRQFREVSNFNVGLFMQQTGVFSLDQTLSRAGTFASALSSNARPNEPHGLDLKTAEWITKGYAAGASGVYGQPAGQ